jgi:hypothetical protein
MIQPIIYETTYDATVLGLFGVVSVNRGAALSWDLDESESKR